MKRQFLLLPLAAAAVVLVVVSTAYACTSFKGQFNVTGNAAGSGTVVATGNGTSMGYKSISSAYAKVTGSSGSLTFSTNADPADANNKLPSGRTYYLRWDPFTGTSDGDFPTHTAWKYDCMEGRYGSRLGTGGVTVSSTGSGGPWVRSIPTTSNRTPTGTDGKPYNEAAACISDGTALYGNQAPVTVV